MSWTISVAQLPILGGVANHGTLVLRDDAGNIRGTINGGPRLPDGGLADVTQLGAYFNQSPLGAEAQSYAPGYQGGYQFWRPGLQETQLATGSQADIESRWNAGVSCANSINIAGFTYYVLPQDDPAAGMGNSNSVAMSVGACMVGDQMGRTQLLETMPNNPGATRSDLLSDSTINQIRANEGLPPILNRWQRTETDELQPDGTHRITYADAETGNIETIETRDAQDRFVEATHIEADGDRILVQDDMLQQEQWTQKLTWSNESGQNALALTRYDDDSEVIEQFDPLDTQPWDTHTVATDADGNVTADNYDYNTASDWLATHQLDPGDFAGLDEASASELVATVERQAYQGDVIGDGAPSIFEQDPYFDQIKFTASMPKAPSIRSA